MNHTIEQAIEAYKKQSELLPNEERIGLFSAADYNGTGEFTWFDNYKELKDFIIKAWFALLTDEIGEKYNTFIQKARAILDECGNTPEEIMAVTNNNPFDDTEIKWIGTVDELLTDQSSFARKLRSHYNDDDKPVKTEEKARFIEFLKDYVWA